MCEARDGFELKNGEVTSSNQTDNKLSAVGLFSGFNSTGMGSTSSGFPFAMPTNNEEVKRDSNPQVSSNSLDIPEILNPKKQIVII